MPEKEGRRERTEDRLQGSGTLRRKETGKEQKETLRSHLPDKKTSESPLVQEFGPKIHS